MDMDKDMDTDKDMDGQTSNFDIWVSMIGNVSERDKIWNDEPEWRVIVCNLEYLIKT